MSWAISTPSRRGRQLSGVSVRMVPPGRAGGAMLEIKLGPAALQAWDVDLPVRVELAFGQDDDLGRVRLSVVAAGGYKLSAPNKGSPVGRLQARVFPETFETAKCGGDCDFRIVDGALFLDLPPAIWRLPEKLEDRFKDDPRAVRDKGSPGPAIGPGRGNLPRRGR